MNFPLVLADVTEKVFGGFSRRDKRIFRKRKGSFLARLVRLSLKLAAKREFQIFFLTCVSRKFYITLAKRKISNSMAQFLALDLKWMSTTKKAAFINLLAI